MPRAHCYALRPPQPCADRLVACRRRRIKCGEERPICNNCIKSKRDCEGYSQRVVFKDPVPVQSAGSNLREDLVDPSKDPEHYLPGTGFPASDELGYETIRTTTQPRQALLPAIAPRPPSQYSFHGAGGMPTPPSPDVESFLRPRGSHPPTPTRSTHAHGFTQPLYPVANVFNPRINGGVSHAHATDDRLDHTVPSQGLIPQQGADSIHRAPPAPTRPIPGPSPTQFHTYSSPALTHDSANGHFVSPDIEQAFQPPASTPVGQVAVANRIVAGVNGSASAKSLQPFPGTAQGDVADATLDPYRTSLDEIMEIDTTPDHTTHEDPHRRDRGLMIALQANDDDHAMRSFCKHLDEPNLLATYRPSATSSGLMDLKTARIFRHFVTVTGPSLSIFERTPGNPYGLFSSPSLPGSRRSLWSYTLPTLALRHPPLLHAMLAVASLHIAKLQGDTVVPSLKHYHMALRRVARYVSLPSKRVELGTLAADAAPGLLGSHGGRAYEMEQPSARGATTFGRNRLCRSQPSGQGQRALARRGERHVLWRKLRPAAQRPDAAASCCGGGSDRTIDWGKGPGCHAGCRSRTCGQSSMVRLRGCADDGDGAGGVRSPERSVLVVFEARSLPEHFEW